MNTISVILTAWQRPQYLEEQVNAVLENSIKPIEVVLWYNQPPKKLGLFERKQLAKFRNSQKIKKIFCDHNFGIIPRFTLASCMEGEYVCIFDDDTIPGKRWFENCLNYVDEQRAMMGTIGLKYLSWDKKVLIEEPRKGWESQNEEIEFVDLVGHSWFFKREWARYFWEQEPPSRTFGEDIHFCAMLQRKGIRSACPPHPSADRSLWGSLKPERGVDGVAISSQNKSEEFARVVQSVVQRGFKPCLGTRRS